MESIVQVEHDFNPKPLIQQEVYDSAGFLFKPTEPCGEVGLGGCTAGHEKEGLDFHPQDFHSGRAEAPKLFLQDAELLIVAVGNRIKVVDTKLGKIVRRLKAHTGGVLSLAPGEEDNVFFSGDKEGIIRKFNASNGEVLMVLEGHLGMVTSLAYCEEDLTLYSGSADRTVIKWDASTGEQRGTLTGHTLIVTCLGISQREGCVYSGSGDMTVKKWHIRSGHLMDTLVGHSAPVANLAVNDRDNILYTVGWGGHQTLQWDLASGRMLKPKEVTTMTVIT